MGHGSKYSNEAYPSNANGVRQKNTVQVIYDETVQPVDGQLLSLLELLQGVQRSELQALLRTSEVRAIALARFRVWEREELEARSTSVIIQIDLQHADESLVRTQRHVEGAPDSSSVEIAGIELSDF